MERAGLTLIHTKQLRYISDSSVPPRKEKSRRAVARRLRCVHGEPVWLLARQKNSDGAPPILLTPIVIEPARNPPFLAGRARKKAAELRRLRRPCPSRR